jgi:hypothetical protein
MTRPVGLTAEGERVWDGVLLLEFRFIKMHSNTARYRAAFKSRAFDIYVPLLALPEEQRSLPPDTLHVAIDRSATAVKRIGFGAEWHPLEARAGVCEFEFAERMVNSVKYQMPHEQQVFSLYVPNAVFGGEPHPKRMFLRLFEK